MAFETIFNALKNKPVRRLVVANGVDAHSIEAAYSALTNGWVSVTLTGSRQLISEQFQKLNIPEKSFGVVDCRDEDEAVIKAVDMAREGSVGLIMKGLISTDKFMRALLNKERGILPAGALLSHVTLLKTPNYFKHLLMSDVAVIPLPTLDQKKVITRYLIDVAHKVGIECPAVAFIAASEQIIQRMPATTEALQLKEMWQKGEFPGSVCDGPMALDLAIDLESAEIKNFVSPVAGKADCLLFPNIESGNVFYKANTKLCQAHTAAMLVGAKVPVVLSSRGDSMETKLNSIALAALAG